MGNKEEFKELKTQHGKPMSRPFAPNKRPAKEDLYKVRIVKKDGE